MLIDSKNIEKNKVIETDVCVIGAGAAGISIVRELIDQKFKVCLMESGGFEFEEETQSLYKGLSTGQKYSLENSRLRLFGGTTNHWGGWCRPFDEIDFEKRDWIPDSGWPFNKSHLNDYYIRAHKICQIGPYNYELISWVTKDSPALDFKNDNVQTKLFQLSPPTRFGKIYRNELIKSENIDVYIYANALVVEANHNAKFVTKVKFSTLQNNIFWVSAKYFVLAAGGIENARLLLLSNTIQKHGLGNHYDVVGRFFMEHQEFAACIFLPTNPYLPMDFYKPHYVTLNNKERKITGIFSVSEEIMRKEKLVNFTLEPESPDPISKLDSSKNGIGVDLFNIIKELNPRNNKEILLKDAVFYEFRNASEQVPNPESRVTLSNKKDRFGLRSAQLNWQLSEIDRESLVRGYHLIGKEIASSGFGRFRILMNNDMAQEVFGQSHHMGTTRMQDNHKKGVVDRNCKIHGIDNFFLAGSSVFPTSSSATPTLTIVALSLRLADHIKKLMKH